MAHLILAFSRPDERKLEANSTEEIECIYKHRASLQLSIIRQKKSCTRSEKQVHLRIGNVLIDVAGTRTIAWADGIGPRSWHGQTRN